jgi:hypothetical protein
MDATQLQQLAFSSSSSAFIPSTCLKVPGIVLHPPPSPPPPNPHPPPPASCSASLRSQTPSLPRPPAVLRHYHHQHQQPSMPHPSLPLPSTPPTSWQPVSIHRAPPHPTAHQFSSQIHRHPSPTSTAGDAHPCQCMQHCARCLAPPYLTTSFPFHFPPPFSLSPATAAPPSLKQTLMRAAYAAPQTEP